MSLTVQINKQRLITLISNVVIIDVYNFFKSVAIDNLRKKVRREHDALVACGR